MTQEIFLNIPAPALEEIVVELRGRGRRWAAVCAAGLFVTGSCVRLVHRASAITRHPQRAVRDVAESGLCPVVALSADRQPNRTTKAIRQSATRS